MKIASFQELCQAKGIVVFSQWRPDSGADGLFRRGRPMLSGPATVDYYGTYSDFMYWDLPPVQSNDDMAAPSFYDVTSGSRWGAFKPDEQFVLYEEADLAALRDLLAPLPGDL